MAREAAINPTDATISMPQSVNGENTDVPDMAALNRSTMYVSGEPYARARPSPCIPGLTAYRHGKIQYAATGSPSVL